MSIMSVLSSLSVCARVSVCACVRFCVYVCVSMCVYVCVCLCVSVCLQLCVELNLLAAIRICFTGFYSRHWQGHIELLSPHSPPSDIQHNFSQFGQLRHRNDQHTYNIHECKSCINIPSFRYGLHCTEYKILFLQCCAEYYRKVVQNLTIHRKSNTREPFQYNGSSVLCTVSYAEKTRTVSSREEEGFVGLCQAVDIYRAQIQSAYIHCMYRVRIHSA